MDIKEKLKELEGSFKKVEDFIGKKGLGSSRLKKAKQKQLKINLALFIVSIISVAGITLWALGKNHED